MFLPEDCLCLSEIISSFRSLRAGSQVFALFSFFCVVLHMMWPGKRMKLQCILPLFILCLPDICNDNENIILAVCMLERVECVYTSPVRTECSMFVMCCMLCSMPVSTVL